MRLHDIQVTNKKPDVSWDILTINHVFQHSSEKYMLALRVRALLKKWERLIVRERTDYLPFDTICYLTEETVLANFNNDYSKLEAYVKRTAMTVKESSEKNISLDEISSDSEDNVVPLLETLTEENKIHYSSNLDETEEMLWSAWVSERREAVLPDRPLSIQELTTLITLAPVLNLVNHFSMEELRRSETSTLSSGHYKIWYNELVNSLVKRSGYTREQVRSELPIWVSYFLQNSQCLLEQFVNWSTSEKLDFEGTRFSNKPRSARVTPTEIVVKASKYYNIFSLDLKQLVNTIFDEYFNYEKSRLRIELSGYTYYNVLSGLFVTEGDLERYITENIIEYINRRIGNCRFICATDDELYFELRDGSSDYSIYHYYFGVSLNLHLRFEGKSVKLKGELKNDFN